MYIFLGGIFANHHAMRDAMPLCSCFFPPGLEGLERLERRIIATSDESLQRPGNEQNIPVFQVFCYFSSAPG